MCGDLETMPGTDLDLLHGTCLAGYAGRVEKRILHDWWTGHRGRAGLPHLLHQWSGRVGSDSCTDRGP